MPPDYNDYFDKKNKGDIKILTNDLWEKYFDKNNDLWEKYFDKKNKGDIKQVEENLSKLDKAIASIGNDANVIYRKENNVDISVLLSFEDNLVLLKQVVKTGELSIYSGINKKDIEDYCDFIPFCEENKFLVFEDTTTVWIGYTKKIVINSDIINLLSDVRNLYSFFKSLNSLKKSISSFSECLYEVLDTSISYTKKLDNYKWIFELHFSNPLVNKNSEIKLDKDLFNLFNLLNEATFRITDINPNIVISTKIEKYKILLVISDKSIKRINYHFDSVIKYKSINYNDYINNLI